MDVFSKSAKDVLRLYFRKDEANNLVMKVTTINHTLDYLKVGLAAVATGLTLFKADFTILKMDEKGITWFGNTIHQFPWAKEGNKWWERAMKLGGAATQKEIDKYKTKTEKQEREAKQLDRRITAAQKGATRANREIAVLRRGLRGAGSDVGTIQATKGKTALRETREAVNKLSQALAGV
ncbi:hypothetical protein ACN2WE_19210 [Streptomyces sp. cg28]|uniref:hypothetical protein n=1 Tax=Streptomyces sp. cg28 TaxID=3403457 RepID=UPI003B21BB49